MVGISLRHDTSLAVENIGSVIKLPCDPRCRFSNSQLAIRCRVACLTTISIGWMLNCCGYFAEEALLRKLVKGENKDS